jgi:hypothetical protein
MKYLLAVFIFLFAGLAHGQRITFSPDGAVSIVLREEICPAYVRTIFGLKQDAELFFAEVRGKGQLFAACWRGSENFQIRLYYAPDAVFEEFPASIFKPMT